MARNPQQQPGGDTMQAAGLVDAATEADLGETLKQAWRLLDTGRVARETAQLGIEILKVFAGLSNIEIDPRDRRFRDPTWTEHPFYHRLGQAYMAYCRAVENSVDGGDDWRNQQRAQLLADVLTSSLAPTNSLAGNPAALKRAFETGGGSLVSGLRNFWQDLRYNRGMPRHLDRDAMVVGRDLALTTGAVVFRNEVLEIIQYQPRTKQVYQRPVLLMTPQINKFYFLDLAPERSFVEHALDNGVQVFMVSWRNPGPEHADWSLDTYCQALLEATDAVRDIAGIDTLNTFGFCAGGITMSAMLGHLADIGDERVHSASYAVTLLDFSTPALIGALKSRPVLQASAAHSRRRGVIEGEEIRWLFSWLRPQDLIWNYWVNNYLMGKAPPAFDILAWNADSTNLPAALHADFLQLFADNLLTAPGGWAALDSPVDLSRVQIDTFVTGAVTDHLTPWKACYRTTQLLGGDSTFVLSNAGHVASLVNPPSNPKASYFVGDETVPDPEDWYAAASERQGSWWDYWLEWIQQRSGDKRNAPRRLGNRNHPPQEAAPGTYVFERPA